MATYSSARISTISSRYFNNLTYKKDSDTIQKTSKDHLKINKEISYYKKIPNEIKRYFPSLVNVDISSEYSSYELDYIGNPTLAEIFLFGRIGPNAFNRIIDNIDRVFKTFYDKSPLIKENSNWLYSKKTSNRQSELELIIEEKNFKLLKNIYQKEFKVNDILYPSLKETFSNLEKSLYQFEKERPLHYGHGDLCFNNILVDPINGKINLIDPKAEKHPKLNSYGIIDSFYDLSKLNHSFEGLYDSVVNNLFKLTISKKNDFSFEIYKPAYYDSINSYFREKIIDKRINSEIKATLTGNLFLSMLPLHIDDQLRMIGFAIIGSIFLTKGGFKNLI